MSFQDILLHIDSYPRPTSEAALDQAVQFVSLLNGRVTALALAIRIPMQSSRLTDYLLKLTAIAREAEGESHVACRARLDYFVAKARAADVLGDGLLETADLLAYSEHLARRAEVRDFCIIPLTDVFDGQIEAAQTVVFASGRPVLVFKAGEADLPTQSLRRAVVAWDGSRCAARALHEALPILQRANEVRLVTVLNEKPAAPKGGADEALRHLQAYGVQPVLDDIQAAGRPIGHVLDDYLQERQADFLVMGAYGRSRLRELVLGGATEHVLHHTKIPVFLAH